MIRRGFRLLRERRGSAAVEFALVAPVMLLLLLGLMDACYRLYVQSILTGAMQRAGRNATLETGASSLATLDTEVANAVKEVAVNATWTSTQESFADYKSMSPEQFDDTNNNGVRDPGECYSDVNDNGAWDASPGRSGLGGANDAVIYTFTVTYPRIFPVGAWLGIPNTQQVSATTVLKNQPYSTQASSTPTVRCL